MNKIRSIKPIRLRESYKPIFQHCCKSKKLLFSIKLIQA